MENFGLYAKTQNINNVKANYMIRILGTVLPNNKCVVIGLTQIYGVGQSTASKTLKTLNIKLDKKISELTETEILNLRNFFDKNSFQFENNLKRTVNLNIKRLIDIKCLRGLRLLKGLPVRGQRTRTNSRTTRRLNILVKQINKK